MRETAFIAVTAICTALQNLPELSQIAVEMAEKLRDGLSDNWSQVIPPSSSCIMFFLVPTLQFVRRVKLLYEMSTVATLVPGGCHGRLAREVIAICQLREAARV